MESRSHPVRRFLIVYAQSGFWSMGEGIGAGSFWRTPSALVERGHEVHIVLPAPAGQPAGDMERDGMRLHFYASPIEFVLPMASLPVRLARRISVYSTYQRIGTRSAMTVAKAVRPDIVLGFGTFEAPVARKVAQSLGVPNVTRLFGNSLSLTLDDPIRFHLNFPEVRAFKTPCARLILTNDGADGEKVAQRCGVPRERFVHLRNGLDFEMFKPGPPDPSVFEKLGPAPGTPILMTVTRLAFEKKLERVIDAMPALLARAPDAVAALVGEGPERPRLEARARGLGVAHAVLMPGAVANRDLPAWYRSAAIVLSLLDRTNASNPVFEGMACERCVVALDTGTTRELVVDGETGVLVEPRDLGGLGATLADLVLDPARRERLGTAARAHVRSMLLDPPARMDQEIAILLQVIEEARTS
jgi:glycosyltransferase involved in cell wall biosynthesis